MIRRTFNIKGNPCLDCVVRSPASIDPPDWVPTVETVADHAIADRSLLHALCPVSSQLRAEEARGGSKGHLATVPVRKAADDLHAASNTADGPAISDDAGERSVSPGPCSLAAPVEDSAIPSRAASDAANGPVCASAAHRSVFESRTTLRLGDVKVSGFCITNSLKDGVSLFSLFRPSWALGLIQWAHGRISRPTTLHRPY